MRVRMTVVAAGAVLAAACSDVNAPTGLDGLGPLAEIVDGRDVGVGNQHFFWLPPIVRGHRRWGGSNLTGLAPKVEIFECTGGEVDPCSSLGNAVKELTALTGRDSKKERGDGNDDDDNDDDDDDYDFRGRGNHYHVNWHTKRGSSDGVDPGTYRICVSLPTENLTLNLGHADVLVGRNGKEVKNARADGNVPLVDGRTLPIKFRIQDGYLDGGSDPGCPGAGGGPTLATLSGTVTLNGLPQSGVTVQLFQFSPVPFPTLGSQVGGDVTTDGNGSYSFGGLLPGFYAVCAVHSGPLSGAVAPCPEGSVGYTLFLPAGLTVPQNFAF